MNRSKTVKNRFWFRLITFVVVTALLCQNVASEARADNAFRDKLAPSSSFKRIEKYLSRQNDAELSFNDKMALAGILKGLNEVCRLPDRNIPAKIKEINTGLTGTNVRLEEEIYKEVLLNGRTINTVIVTVGNARWRKIYLNCGKLEEAQLEEIGIKTKEDKNWLGNIDAGNVWIGREGVRSTGLQGVAPSKSGQTSRTKARGLSHFGIRSGVETAKTLEDLTEKLLDLEYKTVDKRNHKLMKVLRMIERRMGERGKEYFRKFMRGRLGGTVEFRVITAKGKSEITNILGSSALTLWDEKNSKYVVLIEDIVWEGPPEALYVVLTDEAEHIAGRGPNNQFSIEEQVHATANQIRAILSLTPKEWENLKTWAFGLRKTEEGEDTRFDDFICKVNDLILSIPRTGLLRPKGLAMTDKGNVGVARHFDPNDEKRFALVRPKILSFVLDDYIMPNKAFLREMPNHEVLVELDRLGRGIEGKRIDILNPTALRIFRALASRYKLDNWSGMLVSDFNKFISILKYRAHVWAVIERLEKYLFLKISCQDDVIKGFLSLLKEVGEIDFEDIRDFELAQRAVSIVSEFAKNEMTVDKDIRKESARARSVLRKQLRQLSLYKGVIFSDTEEYTVSDNTVKKNERENRNCIRAGYVVLVNPDTGKYFYKWKRGKNETRWNPEFRGRFEEFIKKHGRVVVSGLPYQKCLNSVGMKIDYGGDWGEKAFFGHRMLGAKTSLVFDWDKEAEMPILRQIFLIGDKGELVEPINFKEVYRKNDKLIRTFNDRDSESHDMSITVVGAHLDGRGMLRHSGTDICVYFGQKDENSFKKVIYSTIGRDFESGELLRYFGSVNPETERAIRVFSEDGKCLKLYCKKGWPDAEELNRIAGDNRKIIVIGSYPSAGLVRFPSGEMYRVNHLDIEDGEEMAQIFERGICPSAGEKMCLVKMMRLRDWRYGNSDPFAVLEYKKVYDASGNLAHTFNKWIPNKGEIEHLTKGTGKGRIAGAVTSEGGIFYFPGMGKGKSKKAAGTVSRTLYKTGWNSENIVFWFEGYKPTVVMRLKDWERIAEGEVFNPPVCVFNGDRNCRVATLGDLFREGNAQSVEILEELAGLREGLERRFEEVFGIFDLSPNKAVMGMSYRFIWEQIRQDIYDEKPERNGGRKARVLTAAAKKVGIEYSMKTFYDPGEYKKFIRDLRDKVRAYMAIDVLKDRAFFKDSLWPEIEEGIAGLMEKAAISIETYKSDGEFVRYALGVLVIFFESGNITIKEKARIVLLNIKTVIDERYLEFFNKVPSQSFVPRIENKEMEMRKQKIRQGDILFIDPETWTELDRIPKPEKKRKGKIRNIIGEKTETCLANHRQVLVMGIPTSPNGLLEVFLRGVNKSIKCHSIPGLKEDILFEKAASGEIMVRSIEVCPVETDKRRARASKPIIFKEVYDRNGKLMQTYNLAYLEGLGDRIIVGLKTGKRGIIRSQRKIYNTGYGESIDLVAWFSDERLVRAMSLAEFADEDNNGKEGIIVSTTGDRARCLGRRLIRMFSDEEFAAIGEGEEYVVATGCQVKGKEYCYDDSTAGLSITLYCGTVQGTRIALIYRRGIIIQEGKEKPRYFLVGSVFQGDYENNNPEPAIEYKLMQVFDSRFDKEERLRLAMFGCFLFQKIKRISKGEVMVVDVPIETKNPNINYKNRDYRVIGIRGDRARVWMKKGARIHIVMSEKDIDSADPKGISNLPVWIFDGIPKTFIGTLTTLGRLCRKGDRTALKIRRYLERAVLLRRIEKEEEEILRKAKETELKTAQEQLEEKRIGIERAREREKAIFRKQGWAEDTVIAGILTGIGIENKEWEDKITQKIQIIERKIEEKLAVFDRHISRLKGWSSREREAWKRKRGKVRAIAKEEREKIRTDTKNQRHEMDKKYEDGIRRMYNINNMLAWVKEAGKFTEDMPQGNVMEIAMYLLRKYNFKYGREIEGFSNGVGALILDFVRKNPPSPLPLPFGERIEVRGIDKVDRFDLDKLERLIELLVLYSTSSMTSINYVFYSMIKTIFFDGENPLRPYFESLRTETDLCRAYKVLLEQKDINGGFLRDGYLADYIKDKVTDNFIREGHIIHIPEEILKTNGFMEEGKGYELTDLSGLILQRYYVLYTKNGSANGNSRDHIDIMTAVLMFFMNGGDMEKAAKMAKEIFSAQRGLRISDFKKRFSAEGINERHSYAVQGLMNHVLGINLRNPLGVYNNFNSTLEDMGEAAITVNTKHESDGALGVKDSVCKWEKFYALGEAVEELVEVEKRLTEIVSSIIKGKGEGMSIYLSTNINKAIRVLSKLSEKVSDIELQGILEREGIEVSPIELKCLFNVFGKKEEKRTKYMEFSELYPNGKNSFVRYFRDDLGAEDIKKVSDFINNLVFMTFESAMEELRKIKGLVRELPWSRAGQKDTNGMYLELSSTIKDFTENITDLTNILKNIVLAYLNGRGFSQGDAVRVLERLEDMAIGKTHETRRMILDAVKEIRDHPNIREDTNIDVLLKCQGIYIYIVGGLAEPNKGKKAVIGGMIREGRAFPTGIKKERLDEFKKKYKGASVIEGMVWSDGKSFFPVSGKLMTQVEAKINWLLEQVKVFGPGTKIRIISDGSKPILYNKDDNSLEIHGLLLLEGVSDSLLLFCGMHDARHKQIRGMNPFMEELLNIYMDFEYLDAVKPGEAGRLIEELAQLEDGGYADLLKQRQARRGDRDEKEGLLKIVLNHIRTKCPEITGDFDLNEELNNRNSFLNLLIRDGGHIHKGRIGVYPVHTSDILPQIALFLSSYMDFFDNVEKEIKEISRICTGMLLTAEDIAVQLGVVGNRAYVEHLLDIAESMGSVYRVYTVDGRTSFVYQVDMGINYVPGFDERIRRDVYIPSALSEEQWVKDLAFAGKVKDLWGDLYREIKEKFPDEKTQKLFEGLRQIAFTNETKIVFQLRTAVNMARQGAGRLGIAAALVCQMDIPEFARSAPKCGIRNEDIEGIVKLINCYRKINKAMSYRLNPTRHMIQNVMNFIIQLTEGDPDVLMLALVDCIEYLKCFGRGINELSDEEKYLLMQKIQWICMPLAGSLGREDLAYQMGDLYLRIVLGEEYKERVKKVCELAGLGGLNYEQLSVVSDGIIRVVRDATRGLNIQVDISGRVKTVYSAYNKSREIYDLFGIRFVIRGSPEEMRNAKEKLLKCLRDLFKISKPDMKRFLDKKYNEYDFIAKLEAGKVWQEFRRGLLRKLELTGDNALDLSGINIEVQILPSEDDIKRYLFGPTAHWLYKMESLLKGFLPKYNERQREQGHHIIPDQVFDRRMYERLYNRLSDGQFGENLRVMYQDLQRWKFIGAAADNELCVVRVTPGSIVPDVVSEPWINLFNKEFLGLRRMGDRIPISNIDASSLTADLYEIISKKDLYGFSVEQLGVIKRTTDVPRTYFLASRMLMGKISSLEGERLFEKCLSELDAGIDKNFLEQNLLNTSEGEVKTGLVYKAFYLWSMDEFCRILSLVNRSGEERMLYELVRRAHYYMTGRHLDRKADLDGLRKKWGITSKEPAAILVYLFIIAEKGRRYLAELGLDTEENSNMLKLLVFLDEFKADNLLQIYGRIGLNKMLAKMVLLRMKGMSLPHIDIKLRKTVDETALYALIYELEDVMNRSGFFVYKEERKDFRVRFYIKPGRYWHGRKDMVLGELRSIGGVEEAELVYQETHVMPKEQLKQMDFCLQIRHDDENSVRESLNEIFGILGIEILNPKVSGDGIKKFECKLSVSPNMDIKDLRDMVKDWLTSELGLGEKERGEIIGLEIKVGIGREIARILGKKVFSLIPIVPVSNVADTGSIVSDGFKKISVLALTVGVVIALIYLLYKFAVFVRNIIIDKEAGGALRDMGLPIKISSNLIREKRWRDRAKGIKLRLYPMEIKDKNGMPEKITIWAKVFQAEDLPKGVNARHFRETEGDKNSPLCIVTRIPPDEIRYINELIYHELREEYWEKERNLSKRNAHILASAEQVWSFRRTGGLTLYHEEQIRDLRNIPGRLMELLEESRDVHYTIMEKYLRVEMAMAVRVYENLLNREIRKMVGQNYLREAGGEIGDSSSDSGAETIEHILALAGSEADIYTTLSYRLGINDNVHSMFQALGICARREEFILNLGSGKHPIPATDYNVVNIDEGFFPPDLRKSTDYIKVRANFRKPGFMELVRKKIGLPGDSNKKAEAAILYNMWTYISLYASMDVRSTGRLRHYLKEYLFYILENLIEDNGYLIFYYDNPPEGEGDNVSPIDEVMRLMQGYFGKKISEVHIFKTKKGKRVAVAFKKIKEPLETEVRSGAVSEEEVRGDRDLECSV